MGPRFWLQSMNSSKKTQKCAPEHEPRLGLGQFGLCCPLSAALAQGIAKEARARMDHIEMDLAVAFGATREAHFGVHPGGRKVG